MKHSLQSLVVLFLLATPSARANTQPSYEEQLKEYDRRVAEQKEQSSRDRWVFNGVMLAVCAGIFL